MRSILKVCLAITVCCVAVVVTQHPAVMGCPQTQVASAGGGNAGCGWLFPTTFPTPQPTLLVNYGSAEANTSNTDGLQAAALCDPNLTREIIFSYILNGSQVLWKPGIVGYNADTGAADASAALSGVANEFNSFNSAHDVTGVMCLSNGVTAVVPNGPSAGYAWIGGGAICGTQYCATPFRIGQTVAQINSTTVCPSTPGPDVNGICEFLMPISNMSEPSSAIDPTTNMTLILGQGSQHGPANEYVHTIVGGLYQAYSGPQGGDMTKVNGVFFTAAGLCNPYTTAITAGNCASDGTLSFAKHIYASAEQGFQINGTATGAGNITTNINGVNCVDTGNPAFANTQVASTLATEFVSYFNTNCQQSGVYKAEVMTASNIGGTSNQDIGIEKILTLNGSLSPGVDAAPVTPTTNVGGVTISNTFDFRGTGQASSNEFCWEQTPRWGRFSHHFLILGELMSPTTWAGTNLGGQLNCSHNQAQALVGYEIAIPAGYSGGNIPVTDWALGNSFNVSPGGTTPTSVQSGLGQTQTYLLQDAASLDSVNNVAFQNNFGVLNVSTGNSPPVETFLADFDESPVNGRRVVVHLCGDTVGGSVALDAQVCYRTFPYHSVTADHGGFISTLRVSAGGDTPTGTVQIGASGIAYACWVTGSSAKWGIGGTNGQSILCYQSTNTTMNVWTAMTGFPWSTNTNYSQHATTSAEGGCYPDKYYDAFIACAVYVTNNVVFPSDTAGGMLVYIIPTP